MSKSIREQISFKQTPEEAEIYHFYLTKSAKYGKSEYIKNLIKRDMIREEKKCQK